MRNFTSPFYIIFKFKAKVLPLSEYTAIWIFSETTDHIFANLNRSKLWDELKSEQVVNNYRLFMFDADRLILENLNDNRSFAVISKSHVTLIDKENMGIGFLGFWKKEPIFPDSIFNTTFLNFFCCS